MGIKESQRQAILERDGYQSQMRHYSEEQGWFTFTPEGVKLNIHHIIPTRYAQEVLGWQPEQINDPRNLITLTQEEHIGRRSHEPGCVDPTIDFVVHPDIIGAFEHYGGDRQSFQSVFDQRDIMCQQGQIYWNTDHDVELTQTAELNTLMAAMQGWKYPL